MTSQIFALVISIGKTKYFLQKTSNLKVAQSMFTLIESQQDIVWATVTKDYPMAVEAGSSINMCEISPMSAGSLLPYPHRLSLMQKVVEAELTPRFETVIDGDYVRV